MRPKHAAITEQNIQNSVALDGNPEPDIGNKCWFLFICKLPIIVPHLGKVNSEEY
jgi:hypothetical protein